MPPEVRFVRQEGQPNLATELESVLDVLIVTRSGPHVLHAIKWASFDSFRVVLAHPRSAHLKAFVDQFIGPPRFSLETMQHTILDITARTREIRADSVRWWDGPLPGNAIIADPTRDTGWTRIECQVPFMKARQHLPSVVLYRRDDPLAFEAIQAGYDHFWDSCQTPELR